MIDARRLKLLDEIRRGEDRLTGGSSAQDLAAAMAKLQEWQKLADRLDIVLETAYTITADGAQLRYARATLTPSGREILTGSRRRTPA